MCIRDRLRFVHVAGTNGKGSTAAMLASCLQAAGYRVGPVSYTHLNPSPGNKQGGITTLEDKSCGCVQKGGTAPIMDAVSYTHL